MNHPIIVIPIFLHSYVYVISLSIDKNISCPEEVKFFDSSAMRLTNYILFRLPQKF